jgi:hypothetical protein
MYVIHGEYWLTTQPPTSQGLNTQNPAPLTADSMNDQQPVDRLGPNLNTNSHSATRENTTTPSKGQPTVYNTRPQRILFRKNEDLHAMSSYGTSIYTPKKPGAVRIFFQNIKGYPIKWTMKTIIMSRRT